MDWMHLVSSAKRSGFAETRDEGKSFMKIRKSKGPNTLPWGTPEVTGRTPDCAPLITTICDLLLRYALNQDQRHPVIPIDQSL